MRKRSSRSLGLLRQCMRKHSVATVKFSFGADVDGQSRSLGVENCNFSQKMCSTRFGLPFPRRKRIESRKRKCAVASLIASQSRIDLGTSWVCIYCALGRQCLCFFHALSLCKCMRACTGIKFMCLQCRFSANRYDQVESSSRIASDERRQRKGHVRDG